MRIIYVLLGSLLIGIWGCSSPEETPSPPEAPENLLGMWVMRQVFQDTLDVTDEFNPGWNRWITLNEEGTFESGGAPIGYSSGVWSFDSLSNELFLDSDAGEEDDSYWIVGEIDTMMAWQGARGDMAAQFKLTFIKKGLQ